MVAASGERSSAVSRESPTCTCGKREASLAAMRARSSYGQIRYNIGSLAVVA